MLINELIDHTLGTTHAIVPSLSVQTLSLLTGSGLLGLGVGPERESRRHLHVRAFRPGKEFCVTHHSTPHGAQPKKESGGLADRWPAIFPHEGIKSPYELLP